jgi:hypothetical protein
VSTSDLRPGSGQTVENGRENESNLTQRDCVALPCVVLLCSVQVLTRGPVSVGDAVGKTNWEMLKPCCSSDGAALTFPLFYLMNLLSCTHSTANCIMIDLFSAFELGLVAPFLYAA